MTSKPNPIADSVWLRPPRGRGEQPTLGREQIVRAAIEMLDAEGLAGLSMRRLGARLGSGATSTYWYVANKDELLELAMDEVMGEVYVPEAGDTGWRIAASVLANGMRAMLLRHPWMLSLYGAHPTIGPNAMRIADRSVAVLSAAGFTGMEVPRVGSLLISYAIGAATTAAAVTTAARRSGRSATELFEDLEPYLQRVAPGNPNYEQWRRASGAAATAPAQDWDESFNFGLERLLDGLELWLAPRES